MLTSRMFAATSGNCEVQEVCDFLLENITEEEGIVGQAGFAAVRHSELLLDFPEHCGKTRQEIIDAQVNGELLPEKLGLQSWCWRQSRRALGEAVAPINAGPQSQVPGVYA